MKDFNEIANLLIMYEDEFTKDELFTYLYTIIEAYARGNWMNIIALFNDIEKKINKLEGIE